jgi:hypothetical protein
MSKKYKYVLTIEFDTSEDRVEYIKEEMHLLRDGDLPEELESLEVTEEILRYLESGNEMGIS